MLDVLSSRPKWRARRRASALSVVAAAAAALTLPTVSPAAVNAGPAVSLAPTGWTDCGDGTGGSERLTTAAADATAGHALHEHRYCPTRSASVTYYFYAYDETSRNVCELIDSPCDPAVPFGAYAAVPFAMEVGDFEPGGRCADGCPVAAPLPAANRSRIDFVIAEAVYDTGTYGLTHTVTWDPTPILVAPTEPPPPQAPASDPPTIQLPAPSEPAPTPPPPDTPATSGPAVDGPAPAPLLVD